MSFTTDRVETQCVLVCEKIILAGDNLFISALKHLAKHEEVLLTLSTFTAQEEWARYTSIEGRRIKDKYFRQPQVTASKIIQKDRTSLFWNITQRVMVIPYRHCGTTYRFHLQGSIILGYCTLEDGTDRLFQHIGNNYHTPCVTAHNTAVLMYFAGEA